MIKSAEATRRISALWMFTLVWVVGILCLSLIFKRTGNVVQIDSRTVENIAGQYPVIFVFRHGERCDRSANPCLGARPGISVKSASRAAQAGHLFSRTFGQYVLYSAGTVRTWQTAAWFAGRSPGVLPSLSRCDTRLPDTLLTLSAGAGNRPVVVFTDGQCLNRLAEKTAGKKLHARYLDALVMHVQNGRLVTDGRLMPLR
ncbi:lipopolysaccharide core heptose(II)-phosphate phosphatase [Salmonella enterica]|nr:lipopolysaccharide core heptose(II)-phosphate phosphatase [Salmonella enterica]EHF7826055.1 lipopolysaccharide core heptose(II)-phosphate phosphatase [Salmonella enterica]EHM6139085.1 lipopolysaccharide core heptose(II)-phosphate phosphatase [Salmonella enterica]EHM6196641.1 lipopolysaccharide core heptose(II)-phosphate phosphatase [Salmonella enterica]EIE0789904.1 lipopolysaccharide core heptose(II)-phosphate phosphatase [Salmonella enterica]